MEPLLLFGYTALFVALFGYAAYLQRKLGRVERRLNDLR
jgi:CcmD family protein